jgi:mono/diheme cytochrome c family protein
MVKTYFVLVVLGLTSICLMSSFAYYNKVLTSQASSTETTAAEMKNTFFHAAQQDSLFTSQQIQKARDIIAKTSEADKKQVKAKAKYNMFCGACHGLKGDLEINGSKNLSKSTLSLEESVARIYYGEGMMTAFSELLTEAEILAIAEYVKTNFNK